MLIDLIFGLIQLAIFIPWLLLNLALLAATPVVMAMFAYMGILSLLRRERPMPAQHIAPIPPCLEPEFEDAGE